MAENEICHLFGNPVIKRFVENFERTIASSSFLLSSKIQKYFGPCGKTVYLRGNLIFIDSSVMEIAIFASESGNIVSLDKYRMHYMDNHGKMLFRYDNASHYPKMTSHPHHKHTPDKILSSTIPSIKDVLNEISAFIIGK